MFSDIVSEQLFLRNQNTQNNGLLATGLAPGETALMETLAYNVRLTQRQMPRLSTCEVAMYSPLWLTVTDVAASATPNQLSKRPVGTSASKHMNETVVGRAFRRARVCLHSLSNDAHPISGWLCPCWWK